MINILAFPRSNAPNQPGMELRDYFAAAALQGMLASYADGQPMPKDNSALAISSYSFADAMLKARQS